MPRASFILPTKNMEASIGSLLESIFSQEFDGDIEVLVMDSSDDRTPEIARRFPVKLVRLEPYDFNYGKANNDGASMTDGDLVIYISTDVEISDTRWLSKLTRHFSDPKVAAVHGRQIPKIDASPLEQFFILYTYPAQSKVLSLGDGRLKSGMVLFSNNNSAIRRSVWEEVKFPEMLKSEDQEWAKRALLAGYKIVYDADAVVYHSHRYSLNGVFREYFDSGAALPAILRDGVVDYSLRHFVPDGLRFVFDEYKFLVQNGHWRTIPYAIVYDLAKFGGVFLGSKQRYMPVWMKRALCKKRNHWDKYSDVIQEPALAHPPSWEMLASSHSRVEIWPGKRREPYP